MILVLEQFFYIIGLCEMPNFGDNSEMEEAGPDNGIYWHVITWTVSNVTPMLLAYSLM